MSTNSLDKRLDAVLSDLGPDELARAGIEAWRRGVEATLDGSPCEPERDLRKIRHATAGLTDRERDRYRELWDTADRAFMLAHAAAPGLGWLPPARQISGDAVAGWQAAAMAAQVLAAVLPVHKQTLAAYRQGLVVVNRMRQLLDGPPPDGTPQDVAAEAATFDAIEKWIDSMSHMLTPLAGVARERLAAAQQLDALVTKCLADAKPILDKLDERVAQLGDVDPVPAPWREMLERVRQAVIETSGTARTAG